MRIYPGVWKLRDGSEARIFAIDGKDTQYPVIGDLLTGGDAGNAELWTIKGRYVKRDDYEDYDDDQDIIKFVRPLDAPKGRVFKALCKDSDKFFIPDVLYPSEKEARREERDEFVRLLTEYPIEVDAAEVE